MIRQLWEEEILKQMKVVTSMKACQIPQENQGRPHKRVESKAKWVTTKSARSWDRTVLEEIMG